MEPVRAVWGDDTVDTLQQRYGFESTTDILFAEQTLHDIAYELTLSWGWEEATVFAEVLPRPRELLPPRPTVAVLSAAESLVPSATPSYSDGTLVSVTDGDEALGFGRESWSLGRPIERPAEKCFLANGETAVDRYVFTTGDHPDEIPISSDTYIVVSQQYADFTAALLDLELHSDAVGIGANSIVMNPVGVGVRGVVAYRTLQGSGMVGDHISVDGLV